MNYRDVLFYKYLHGSGGSQPAWDGATFSSYAKGMEQILPENESDPDSAPFLGDIRYPDGTRRNNYFTYRESPNTVDGQAKITRVKGNTVVFNQLVQNGNFANSNNWVEYFASLSVNNGVATLTTDYTDPIVSIGQTCSFTAGHKLYVCFEAKSDNISQIKLRKPFQTSLQSLASSFSKYQFVASSVDNDFIIQAVKTSASASGSFDVKNCMCLDLTLMGIDNLTTIAEVEAWLSSHIGNLPYYDYTQGKLLPFKGTSLKATGKNLVDISNAVVPTNNNNRVISNNTSSRIFAGESYTITFDNSNYWTAVLIAEIGNYPSAPDININSFIYDSGWKTSGFEFTSTVNGWVCVLFRRVVDATMTAQDVENIKSMNFMFARSDVSSVYAPYETNSLSLPVLDYFPTGLKAVPNGSGDYICDEITESKAITRVGSVDLGTLTYTYDSNLKRFYSGNLSSLAKFPLDDDIVANVVSSAYSTVSISVLNNDTSLDKVIGLSRYGSVMMRNLAYTDATTFKNAMSGVYLYYELATPTEQPISSQTELQNQALSTILGKTVSVDSPEEPLNILLKGE